MSQIPKNKNKKFGHEGISSISSDPDLTKSESLKPLEPFKKEDFNSLKNPLQKTDPNEDFSNFESQSEAANARFENSVSSNGAIDQAASGSANKQNSNKKQRSLKKDQLMLKRDRWLARNGHNLTYVGIFLFTLVLYFRPYETIPGLSGFSSIALIIAVATLLAYVPTQFSLESSLTIFTIEIKCVIFLTLWAILTMPLAKDPGLAWKKFSEEYIKIVLIFIVMVNILRTQARIKGLMWLSIAVGIMLSYQALSLYYKGEFKVEGYRVNVEIGGMFGNPNNLAIHLVIFTPIVFMLGMASQNKTAKLLYFIGAAMMVAGNMVTQSRGAFLGLVAVGAILVWKLSHRQRVKTILISSIVAILIIVFAPGNYGLRILSIFDPSLDPVGSSNERMALLNQSIEVTLRNPFGIGFANFPVVGLKNLETHNAYTQVSSELGWLALIAYLILLISPWRKLAAVERRMYAEKDFSWIYYSSIGVQASIAAYMISSFFGPVAYDWYVYYPIAYAVGLRRIYYLKQTAAETNLLEKSNLINFKTQKA